MNRTRLFMAMVGGLLFVLLILIGLTYNEQLKLKQEAEVNNAPATELTIVTTFYPWQHITEQIIDQASAVGNSSFSIASITPAGVEPHEYEPTPQGIASLYDADLFILNGNGLDPWAEDIQDDLRSHGVQVLNISDVLSAQVFGGSYPENPHYWLDPLMMKLAARAIQDALISLDTAHPDRYTAGAEHYIDSLDALDQSYKVGLSGCEIRTVIVSHDAFHYLGLRYNIDFLPIAGLSPEEEPTPTRLAELASIVEAKGIKYIFFETLATPEVAQTLADETGTQTLVLNPIEGVTQEERLAGKTYISIMLENLANLRTAMQCQ